jgi:hypothetical protein
MSQTRWGISARNGRARRLATPLGELGRGSEVRFVDRRVDRRGGLVEWEGELHTLDCAILVGLALALPLRCALANDFGVLVGFEVRCLEFMDGPASKWDWKLEIVSENLGWRTLKSTDRPFSLSSLSPMFFATFLNSRLDLALSVSTIRFCRCHRRQLKFSRRWPCSR